MVMEIIVPDNIVHAISDTKKVMPSVGNIIAFYQVVIATDIDEVSDIIRGRRLWLSAMVKSVV